MKTVFAPADDRLEAALIEGIDILPASRLTELVAHRGGERDLAPLVADQSALADNPAAAGWTSVALSYIGDSQYMHYHYGQWIRRSADIGRLAVATQTMPLRAAQDSCWPALLPKLTLSKASELAAGFKALAAPTRVQILCLLLDADEQGLCVRDIALSFPLGQPTISHHLTVLKDAGLVGARKEGLWVFDAVNGRRLAHLGIALPAPPVRTERSTSSDRCRGGSASGKMP